MKAWIASDLHFGAWQKSLFSQPLTVPEADVFVCAGDVSNSLPYSLEWLKEVVCPHMPVILVLGNHDYYGKKTISDTLSQVRQGIDGHPITLLENSAVEFGQVRFIGATLWTDYRIVISEKHDLPEDVRQQLAMREMPDRVRDFGEIWSERKGEEYISPAEIIERHHVSRAFIEAELSHQFAGKTVVVSHHLPLTQSLDERFLGQITCASYASDLSHMIKIYRPKYWIHGHTHQFLDYRLADTRIICNPRGFDPQLYPNGFRPDFVIEI